MEQYKKHIIERVAKGRKKPLGEGALIIDEVKVYACIIIIIVTIIIIAY